MGRLTEQDSQGNWGLKGVRWVDIMPGAAITQEVYEKLYGALFKLKDYEDTGLSPDEVEEMKAEENYNEKYDSTDMEELIVDDLVCATLKEMNTYISIP